MPLSAATCANSVHGSAPAERRHNLSCDFQAFDHEPQPIIGVIETALPDCVRSDVLRSQMDVTCVQELRLAVRLAASAQVLHVEIRKRLHRCPLRQGMCDLMSEGPDLIIDRARRAVTRAGRPVPLARKELGVLEVLVSADGAVVTAEQLLEQVWDEHADPFTNVVAVTVLRLRRELGQPPMIETVIGGGYRIA
jgi:DNA-binding response OmpR family regulator